MQKSKLLILSILLATGYWLLATSSIANAAGIVPCGTKETHPCTICDLFVGVDNIIHFLTFGIAMPLGVVVLIYGGVMILTSGGSEDKLKKGQTALWRAIWGLVIVFAGVLIIDTILTSLVAGEFEWFTTSWKDIPSCP